jgi:phage terminase large subunit GpA-like protein
MSDALLRKWVVEAFENAIPRPPEMDIAKWAEANFFPNPGVSDRWKLSVSPWNKPLFDWFHTAKRITNCKPVQSGGSTVGEILICWLIANAVSGDIQYNWETNEKANDRWDKRLRPILEKCPPVARLFPMQRGKIDNTKMKRGLINFPHLNFTMQGVHESKNVDSDTIRYSICEEVHGWVEGRLEKAVHRMTAVYRGKMIEISNASDAGQQFDIAWRSGSQQFAEWRCPACGHWQIPHFLWRKGTKGGLRFDKAGCISQDGIIDMQKMKSTIYYECENAACDARFYDTPQNRRMMADNLRVSAPRNPGALSMGHASYTYDSIIIHYLDGGWATLVKEYLDSLRALDYGDIEPYAGFLKHRCCIFWDKNKHRPFQNTLEISAKVTKNHEGLPDRETRLMTVDKQAGSATRGEAPHFWVVIRDWGKRRTPSGETYIISQLVWEGRRGLEEDVESLRIDYNVDPRLVLVDSGYKATEVYQMCYRYGFTAIKGEPRKSYTHIIPDNTGSPRRVERIYSPPADVDAFAGDIRQRGGNAVAKLIRYSKEGIRDRLNSVRTARSVEWITPRDVSDDYRKHMEAEELIERTNKKTGNLEYTWVQNMKRNDLFVCECYNVLLAEMVGFFVGIIAEEKIERENTNPTFIPAEADE